MMPAVVAASWMRLKPATAISQSSFENFRCFGSSRDSLEFTRHKVSGATILGQKLLLR